MKMFIITYTVNGELRSTAVEERDDNRALEDFWLRYRLSHEENGDTISIICVSEVAPYDLYYEHARALIMEVPEDRMDAYRACR